jgi:hypothetical protein
MTTVKDAIDDLFNNQRLPVEEAVERHFAPSFRQKVDGAWSDRGAFLARTLRLRASVARAKVTVLDELADGPRYAERHLVELVLRDGERAVQEVYVFARRDTDGRFLRIEETALPLREEQAGPGPAATR